MFCLGDFHSCVWYKVHLLDFKQKSSSLMVLDSGMQINSELLRGDEKGLQRAHEKCIFTAQAIVAPLLKRHVGHICSMLEGGA